MIVLSFLTLLVVALVLWDTVYKVKSLSFRLSDLHEKDDALTRRLDESALLADEAATAKLEKHRRAVDKATERLVAEMGMDRARAEDIAKDPALAEAMLERSAL